MAKKEAGDDALRCSFCNKSQREVKKLIAGPTVFICDECVDICLDIIAEDRLLEQQQETKLPKPAEIKSILAHPAVTCAIPGTRRIAHLNDNLGAARGRLPSEALRRKMLDHLQAL